MGKEEEITDLRVVLVYKARFVAVENLPAIHAVSSKGYTSGGINDFQNGNSSEGTTEK
jgi:hypothetical protein